MYNLSVQSDPKRSAVTQGSTGVAHHGSAHVPNVQTKCTAGCDRLYPPRHDHNHASANTSTKVSHAHPLLLMSTS